MTSISFASWPLLDAKAPWVDEMYTWYGIHHDNFGQFWDSIGSGINYSPPLYFFLNWIWQLFLPLSLNALRVESLLWILGGTVLVYLTLRKQLGSAATLIGVGGVLLQSSLLFGQSMEARSYGLFFFCGAAVLYTGQSLTIDQGKRNTWAWAFLAHVALCLTHYLGIVFSGLAALSRYLSTGQSRNRAIRTSPEIASWIVSLPVYIFLINKQSSHLNTWSKANGLQDLLVSYLDSINPLFFSIPFILALFLNPTSNKEKNPIGSEDNNKKFILFCSILWISIPTLIWLLSHVTPLNLFKDRYFMPKEAAWMVLIAVILARIPFLRSNSRKTIFPVGVCILLGVGMLTLSTQRQLFALHPSRNYYHWLIIDESIRNSSLPKVYAGDHLYFPNKKDKGNEGAYLWINNTALRRTYNGFSNDISFISTEELIGLQHFILIHDWTTEECIKRISNFGKINIKVSRSLNKDSKFFADEIQLESDVLE
jgi:hypothetical protein